MYTIISDGVSLAPYQKMDGTWGWYVVEFLCDSREHLNGKEVLVNIEAETEEDLVVMEFTNGEEELDELNDRLQDLSEEEGW